MKKVIKKDEKSNCSSLKESGIQKAEQKKQRKNIEISTIFNDCENILGVQVLGIGLAILLGA